MKRTTWVCVVLQSRQFHPEKFLALSKVLAAAYIASGMPSASLMQGYLAVYTKDEVQLQVPDAPVRSLQNGPSAHALVPPA